MDCKRVAVTNDDDPLAMAGLIGPPLETSSIAAKNVEKSEEEAPLAKLDIAKTRVVKLRKPAKDKETAPEAMHGDEVLAGFVPVTESIQPLADSSSVSEERLPASNDGPFGNVLPSATAESVVSTASAAGFVGSEEDEATEDLLVARLLEREKHLGGATDLFGESAVKSLSSQQSAGLPIDLGVEDQFLAKVDQALAIQHEEQPPDRSSAPQATAQPAGLKISDDFDFNAYIKSATTDTTQPSPRGGGLFD